MPSSPSSKSLTAKVISGSLWMVTLRVARRAIGLINTVVLARILSPDDYGLLAIGLMCISLGRVLTEFGVKQNLVQDRHHSEPLLATAWTIQVLRGLAISVFIFFVAPWAAAFFHEPAAVSFIRALSVIPLLNSCQSIRIIYFQRELQFQKVFLYEFSGTLAGLATGIAAAVLLRNAWALVLAQLAATVVPLAMSWLLFPQKPRFRLDPFALRKLYAFGKWVMLLSLLSYCSLEGDKYFIARLFDKNTIGLYMMAAMLTNLIPNEFGKSIAFVLFPAYAQLNHDRDKLKTAFFKSYETLLSILAPTCLALSLVADDLTRVIFGQKWLAMIPLLRWLALAAMVRVFFSSASGLFLAVNRPQYNFLCEIVRAPTLLLLMVLLPAHFDSMGVVLAVLLANLSFFLIYQVLCCRVLTARLAEFVRIYLPLAGLLAAMYAAVQSTQTVFAPGLMRLSLSLFTGAFLYVGAACLLYRFYNTGPATHWLAVWTRMAFKPRTA